MSERWLILGKTGQLARALETAAAASGYAVICAGRDRADLADPGAARRLIAETGPAVVINAAAYTAVDAAETDEDAAHAVNARGAGEAAEASREAGARHVFVSTDYVFNENGPHTENAPPDPVNAYGRSKLAGERLVAEADPGAAIVRTGGVFSGRGGDFPSAMWRLAAGGGSVRVVQDQKVTPTPSAALAERLVALAAVREAAGLFHCGGLPGASWFEVAEAALAVMARCGGPGVRAEPITSAQFPRPATRPHDSRLSGRRLIEVTGLAAPDWRAGLVQAYDVWRAPAKGSP